MSSIPGATCKAAHLLNVKTPSSPSALFDEGRESEKANAEFPGNMASPPSPCPTVAQKVKEQKVIPPSPIVSEINTEKG